MRDERFPVRDRTYGLWHRVRSIVRYLATPIGESLCMADLDSILYVEYRWGGKMPLALIEVARDVGQADKDATLIARLAELANLPAFCVLYLPSDESNPSAPQWPDIDRFRVRRLWPKPSNEWREMTPQQWALTLVSIRDWQLQRLTVRPAENDETFWPPEQAA